MFPPHPNGRVSGPVCGGQRLAHNRVHVKQKKSLEWFPESDDGSFCQQKAASHPVFRAEFLRMSPLHPLASECNGKKTQQSGTPSAVRLRQSRCPRPPRKKIRRITSELLASRVSLVSFFIFVLFGKSNGHASWNLLRALDFASLALRRTCTRQLVE
jgi:hypothetical protein